MKTCPRCGKHYIKYKSFLPGFSREREVTRIYFHITGPKPVGCVVKAGDVNNAWEYNSQRPET